MKCPECGADIQPQPVVVTDSALAERHYCVFCGKSGREKGKIIIGPHGSLCPDCVKLAMEMIQADENG